LNYFNYFTEIEDAFVRRRGKHLLLSPMDWALIESWKEMNVPLHVALRGIERSFDSWEAKPRKRSIKSLLYCQEEVEAQFAEWLEARAGAAEDENGAGEPEAADSPFSRTAIAEHLQRCVSELRETSAAIKRKRDDELSEALDRAVLLLNDLENDLEATTTVNAQKLETSLTGIERMLSESILKVVAVEKLHALKTEIKDQLKPYRTHMEKAVYQQTFDNLLLKRLRELFSIPRLSLFYL
jgi:hypothetical protein